MMNIHEEIILLKEQIEKENDVQEYLDYDENYLERNNNDNRSKNNSSNSSSNKNNNNSNKNKNKNKNKNRS